MTPETAGAPTSEQKWVRSSLRHLRDEMLDKGHPMCPTTISRLLKGLGYSLKANVKRLAGTQHPDRDTQFQYIESQKQAFFAAGQPVISVDTKKKELVGNFKNAGQCWCQDAEIVNDHDFATDATVKAVPYGIYDLQHNAGYVYIGQSADTAEFAVTMIADWWNTIGCHNFSGATQLLILCDGGGSNGWRSRLWKAQLQEQLADLLGLQVSVCHYPTGTSKWNPIEHRLFGPISINWAGKPLRTLETLRAYIRGTTTHTGLQVSAFLVEQVFKRGVKVSDETMEGLNLEHHDTCPNWNYTIRPHTVCAACT